MLMIPFRNHSICVQFKVLCTLNSRNKKCITFLICTIFIKKIYDLFNKNPVLTLILF